MSPLRRTGPPARRTPLVARTPLAPGVPLQRSAPLARTSPLRTHAEFRAVRPVITADELTARATVKARAAGLCEGCQRAPSTDYAHRVGRAQGGPWCPANALALCRRCHEWSHGTPVEARSVGWLLRSTDDYLTFPVLLPRGLVLLGTDGTFTPTERGA